MSKLPKEVKLKIVGKVVMSTINNKVLKANLEKDVKEKLKDYVEKFNKKPQQFWLDKIVKTLTPITKPVKEEVDAKTAKKKAINKVKEVKATVAKAKVTKTKAEKLAKIVDSVTAHTTQSTTQEPSINVESVKEVEEAVKTIAPAPVSTPRTRGREW